MRWTAIKNGIQARINYLMGTNDTDPANPLETSVTIWSAQASMIKNIRRVVKAIVGSSAVPYGRVMKGMRISQNLSNLEINITPGIAFTPAGNIIVLQREVTKSLGSPSVGDEIPVYLMYEERQSDLDEHEVEISGTTDTPQNIIYDDKISGTDTEATILENVQITTQDLGTNDGVYIGKVTITSVGPNTFDIAPSNYVKDQTVGPERVDFSHTGGFTMSGTITASTSGNSITSEDAIFYYDGVSEGSKVHVIGTNNRLRYVRVFRDIKADDGGRPAYDSDNPEANFITAMQVWGWQSDGAGAVQLTADVDLSDPTNDNSVDTLEYSDVMIPNNIYALTVKTITVGPKAGSSDPNWNDWYPSGYGPARIDFVVERLTEEE